MREALKAKGLGDFTALASFNCTLNGVWITGVYSTNYVKISSSKIEVGETANIKLEGTKYDGGNDKVNYESKRENKAVPIVFMEGPSIFRKDNS